jgi:hypothetical protein
VPVACRLVTWCEVGCHQLNKMSIKEEYRGFQASLVHEETKLMDDIAK